jgi:hypothetical protein
MPLILATQEAKSRRITVQSQPGQIVCETLSQKYQTEKGAGRVVERLHSNHKALSSNPVQPKKKRKVAHTVEEVEHRVEEEGDRERIIEVNKYMHV